MFKRLFGLGAALWIAFALQSAVAADKYSAYAPPAGVWGPQVGIRAHLGAASYKVSCKAIGKTLVIAEVEYFDKKTGKLVKVEFKDSITFETADVIAQPKIRCKGIPTGSAVEITVE